MTYPLPAFARRAPRVKTTEYTPAVLRFPSGDTVTGRVEVFSSTGGLLCLPKPLIRGTRINVMFLTPGGPGARRSRDVEPCLMDATAIPLRDACWRGSTQTAAHSAGAPRRPVLRSSGTDHSDTSTRNPNGSTNTGLRSARTRHDGRCWKECWKRSGRALNRLGQKWCGHVPQDSGLHLALKHLATVRAFGL